MLSALAAHASGTRLLTDGSAGISGGGGGGGGAPALSRETLPSNLHSMSVGALKGVCAVHGITLPGGEGADELIRAIELALHKAEGLAEPLLLV